jgi:hypothetical protein
MTRSFPRVKLTTEQFRELRARRQEGTLALVNDLHDAGFTSLTVESMAIGKEDYYLRVTVDREELGSDEVLTLLGVAEAHRGSVSLRHEHGQGSRLSVWLPRKEGDDAYDD